MCDTDYTQGYESEKIPHGTGEPFAWRQGMGAYMHDRGSPDAYQPADGTDYTQPTVGATCPASCVRNCYNGYPGGTEGFHRCLSQCRQADLKLQSRSCGAVGCSRTGGPAGFNYGPEHMDPPLPVNGSRMGMGMRMGGPNPDIKPIRLIPLWVYWAAAMTGLAVLLYALYRLQYA